VPGKKAVVADTMLGRSRGGWTQWLETLPAEKIFKNYKVPLKETLAIFLGALLVTPEIFGGIFDEFQHFSEPKTSKNKGGNNEMRT
jgi:hypothetical protein